MYATDPYRTNTLVSSSPLTTRQGMKIFVSNVDLQRCSIYRMNIIRSMLTVMERRRCRRGASGFSNEKYNPTFKTFYMPTCFLTIYTIPIPMY